MLPDGVLIGGQDGGVVVPVVDGDGDFVGFGGTVGRGFPGGELEELLLGAGRLELVDAALEVDDGLVDEDEGLGDTDEDRTGWVVPGAEEVGAACWVLVTRMIAPGSTRGSAAGSELETRPMPVLGILAVVDRVPDRVAGGAVAALVLTGPAAPEPKSALRCTNPMCAATCPMPGKPLTAAATPETESVPTVMAAITPARARVRRRRAYRPAGGSRSGASISRTHARSASPAASV